MIDRETIESFQRDGAVCVRQLFTPGEIAELRVGIDANLASLSPRAKLASGPDDPGRFVEDFCNWQENAHYRRFIFESSLPEAAGRLMQSTSVRLYHDHMLTKEPRTKQSTPWHQDQPYYNIEGRQNVSFWIPVDPANHESTLEFVAGSHLGPWLMPRSFMDAQAKWFPEGTLADLPDIVMLHAARGVTGTHRRRVFPVRFLGDDIRHAPRRWKTSPEFPGLVDELPAGAPMHHPLFPVLWSAQ